MIVSTAIFDESQGRRKRRNESSKDPQASRINIEIKIIRIMGHVILFEYLHRTFRVQKLFYEPDRGMSKLFLEKAANPPLFEQLTTCSSCGRRSLLRQNSLFARRDGIWY